MDACLRLCNGHSCGSLRYPPAGVAPFHCSSLSFLGCDCTGCCLDDLSSRGADCPWPGTPCEFACSLRNIRPPGCTESGEKRCGWCSDFAVSECEGLFFIDPWQIRERTVARVCKARDGKCVAENGGTMCSEILHCSKPNGNLTVLDVPLPLRLQGESIQPPSLPNPVTMATSSPIDQTPVGAPQLNRWWRLGKPSNDVTQAGVLVRQFDALSSKESAKPWEQCAAHDWCAKYNQIWPASIINMFHHNRLYRGSNEGGFVLAPPPLNRFFCAYAGDGNSMGLVDHELHGCQRPCQLPKKWDCSFAPDQLQSCLEAQLDKQGHSNKHNEVVIDAAQMREHLPHSILGIFFMDNSTKAAAVRVHKAFIDTYKLSSTSFPLLHLSLENGFSNAS